MVLAKRGAEAALRRARAPVAAPSAQDAAGDVYGNPATEPLLVMADHDNDPTPTH